jgi:CRP-like cAMP-binding protein
MNHAYFPTVFNIGISSVNLEAQEKKQAEMTVFLSNQDWELLLEKAETRLYQPDDVILQMGEQPQAMYLISKGQVRIEQRPGRVLAYHGPGAVFGEMSFLQGKEASASVIAVDKVEIRIMHLIHVNSLLNSVPGLATRFYQTLAVTLAQRLQKASELLSQNS